jgi:hypothetical protein
VSTKLAAGIPFLNAGAEIWQEGSPKLTLAVLLPRQGGSGFPEQTQEAPLMAMSGWLTSNF